MIERVLDTLAKDWTNAKTLEKRCEIEELAIGYIQTKSSSEALTTHYYDMYYSMKSKYLRDKKCT